MRQPDDYPSQLPHQYCGGHCELLGGPFGFDAAAMVRTSILPRGQQEQQDGRPIKYNQLQSDLVGSFLGRLGEQVPTADVVANGIQLSYSADHLMQGDRGMDAQGHRTGLWNALKQFVPNDPMTQSLMQRLAEDQGIDRVQKPSLIGEGAP